MNYRISDEPVDRLAELAAISIRFVTHSVLDVVRDHASGPGVRLRERALERPYAKDYDAIPGEGPSAWSQRFDTSRWGLLIARDVSGEGVGGAVVAWNTPGVDLLEGREDLAVLWDLRVAPAARRRGVGRSLFQAAAAWAAERGCRELRVETQNVNPAACRFYAAQGCGLVIVREGAYAELPGEVQLIWSLPLPLIPASLASPVFLQTPA